jgi:hypothetical protein
MRLSSSSGKCYWARMREFNQTTSMGKEGRVIYWSERLIPPLIDLITASGFLFLVPWLGEQLFSQSSTNHLLLLPGFPLILTGIVAIRQLPEYSVDENKAPSVIAVCLIFIQILVYSMLYSTATNLGGDGKGNDTAAAIIFAIFLLPVIGAFSWPVTRTETGSGRALAASSLGLISINYLSIIGTAVWSHFASLPSPEDSLRRGGIGFLVMFGITFLIFLTCFGLPRLFLLRATGDRVGLGIYLIGLAIFLWDKIPS